MRNVFLISLPLPPLQRTTLPSLGEVKVLDTDGTLLAVIFHNP